MRSASGYSATSISMVIGEGSPLARLAVFAAVLVSLAALALSWNLPILEAHGFRQTQTAISAYWMAASSNWLAYQTPVLGYPWSIPFEFPVFQALALAVTSALPVNLDQAGRLVSWLFAIATIVPLRLCLQDITGRAQLADTASLLFLLSPLYLFWSRAFMMESTALFFSVSFLALVVRYWRAPSWKLVVAMGLAAILAALVKITTFFGFAFAAALFLISSSPSELVRSGFVWTVRRSVPIVLCVCVALILTVAWIKFSDIQKSKTVWGHLLTSQNLSTWNYGTWAQKTSFDYWRGVAFGRAARELLGSPWALVFALSAVLAFGRGLRLITVGLLISYATPFFVFANLHQIHNYYQYANGVFLVCIAACGIEALRESWDDRLATIGTVVIAVMLLMGFRRDFLPLMNPQRIGSQTLALASFAREHTGPDDVLLGFGLQWSPEVPYYATRRAMLINEGISSEEFRKMRLNPSSFAGSYPVGLVIACPNPTPGPADAAAEYEALFDSAVADRVRFRVAGCDVYK